MNQFDLFDEFGIQPDVKKQKPKDKSSAPKKSAGKSKNTVGQHAPKVNLPAIVYTGYREPLIIESDMFDGKTQMSQQDILEFLSKTYEEFYIDLVGMDVTQKSVCYVSYKANYVMRKGEISLKDSPVLALGGHRFELPSNIEEESGQVPIELIQKTLEEENPLLRNTAIVRNEKNHLGIVFSAPAYTKQPTFPVRLFLFGRGKWEITREDYQAYMMSLGKKEEDIVYDINGIKTMVVERYPDFSNNHLELLYDDKMNIVIVAMKLFEEPKHKIEKMKYPTNCILSFIFEKIQLDPSMFEGNEEVEEEEMIAFCHSRYPEYTKDNTDFIFNKEGNFLMPRIKGSSKGALSIAYSKEEYDSYVQKPYALFEYENGGNRFRVESTPISVTAGNMEGNTDGWFSFRLTKMPMTIYNLMDHFFRKVSEIHGTEVLLHIYYDKDEKKYILFLPRQIVSACSIKSQRDEYMDSKYWLVADFHSHCHFNAFFSHTDNNDELGNRIYGVYGGYLPDGPTQFLLRAGTGGHYVNINKEDIFYDTLDTMNQYEIGMEVLLEDYLFNVIKH